MPKFHGNRIKESATAVENQKNNWKSQCSFFSPCLKNRVMVYIICNIAQPSPHQCSKQCLQHVQPPPTLFTLLHLQSRAVGLTARHTKQATDAAHSGSLECGWRTCTQIHTEFFTWYWEQPCGLEAICQPVSCKILLKEEFGLSEEYSHLHHSEYQFNPKLLLRVFSSQGSTLITLLT